MSSYGIQPTGYVRKPISVILAELEAAMVTEFGPGVIQTPQSPLGQLNGLMADLLAEVDERNLDLYQSYDPDQAEGKRLEMLARIRLVSRFNQSDEEFRKAITNNRQGRIDVQDLAQALVSLEGVTYVRVFINDTGETVNPELEQGVVAIAVIGGTDELVAETIRRYVVPGVSTYGNVRITTTLDGFCRAISIIRPIQVPVQVSVKVKISKDRTNCPAPSTSAISAALALGWAANRENGMGVNAFNLRSLVEGVFSNVELYNFTASRPDMDGVEGEPIPIAFTEMAELNVSSVEVV